MAATVSDSVAPGKPPRTASPRAAHGSRLRSVSRVSTVSPSVTRSRSNDTDPDSPRTQSHGQSTPRQRINSTAPESTNVWPLSIIPHNSEKQPAAEMMPMG